MPTISEYRDEHFALALLVDALHIRIMPGVWPDIVRLTQR